MIVEPCTRMPCDCNSRARASVWCPSASGSRWWPIQARARSTDAHLHELPDVIRANRIGRRKPRRANHALPCAFIKSSSSAPRRRTAGVLIHHEERPGAGAALRLAHDPEEILAAFEERDGWPLPPKRPRVVRSCSPSGIPTEGMIVPRRSRRARHPHAQDAEDRTTRESPGARWWPVHVSPRNARATPTLRL